MAAGPSIDNLFCCLPANDFSGLSSESCSFSITTTSSSSSFFRPNNIFWCGGVVGALAVDDGVGVISIRCRIRLARSLNLPINRLNDFLMSRFEVEGRSDADDSRLKVVV